MIKTTNQEWGFYGTFEGDKDAAWAEAMAAIVEATKSDEKAVQRFLDSRHGRHFADDVNQYGITEAMEKWTGWKAPRSIRRELSLPADTNYLTAFVLRCQA